VGHVLLPHLAMTEERKLYILKWLGQKTYRHVERFCTGVLNGPKIAPEEMRELVDEGLAMVKRHWYWPPHEVTAPCQFYITNKGREFVGLAPPEIRYRICDPYCACTGEHEKR
jgi:hypothetical protein